MDTNLMIQTLQDPLGVPFYPVVFQGLGILTFALHIFFVNLVLGGALIALFFSLTEWIRLRMKIRRLEGRGQLRTAAESVGRTKQSRVIRAARCLIAARPKLAERPMRFDVVAISRGRGHNAIEWIKDAFRP